MKHITTAFLALAFAGLAGAFPVLAEDSVLDDSILLSSYRVAQEGDDGLALTGDECCGGMEECGQVFYCGPRWTVSVGAEIKQRNDMPEFPLVEGVGGRQLMATSDLDVDWGAGPRIEIMRHMDCGLDFEVIYFGIDNFTGSAVAYNGTPLATWYWGQYVFDELHGFYSNDLYSLEFNLQWPLCDDGRWKGIAGVRGMELKEELIAEVSLAQPPFGILTQRGSLSLDNHLYGFQLGAEGILWEPCCQFRIEAFAKAGIYGNHADWIRITEGDFDIDSCHIEDCQSAFVSELGLMAVYKPTCCTKVFAGWQALHLKEVATASVQKKEPKIVFDHSFYHGIMVGFEVSFGTRCCTPCESCGYESCACE